jgi:LDH2 family malate/lactate/ureidoglycolate dehydrogenase
MANNNETIRFSADRLHSFAVSCLVSAGASQREAEIVADTLVATDLRGIESHGVARLRRYVDGLRKGTINAKAALKIIAESPATAVIDADNGLGQPAAVTAMDTAITKAKNVGIGAVAVRHTNHFGMAGYYAMRAVEQKMIGIAISNASPQVAPTFGAEPMYGTNPVAVAIPTDGRLPFVLDMATSIVPRGKLERMSRAGQTMPSGWAINPDGDDATEITQLIEGLKHRRGHALLPLGGKGETFGGHKGYGLGLLVDLLCGPFAGAAWGRHVYGARGANLGQCFVAISVDAFRSRDEFLSESSQLIDEIRTARKLEGASRIYIPGEKEGEESQERSSLGIPLNLTVYNDLQALGLEHKVTL